jgi:hypothetical protein
MPIRDQIQYRLVLQYSVPKIQYFYSLYSILADKKSNLRSLNSQLSSKEDFFRHWHIIMSLRQFFNRLSSSICYYNELKSVFILLSQAQFLYHIIMSLRQFFITSPVNLFDKSQMVYLVTFSILYILLSNHLE